MRKTIAPKPPSFASVVQQFFTEYLVAQRAVSPRTVACYRDALMLFLDFSSQRLKKTATNLKLSDIQPDLILAFLDHLERERPGRCLPLDARLFLAQKLPAASVFDQPTDRGAGRVLETLIVVAGDEARRHVARRNIGQPRGLLFKPDVAQLELLPAIYAVAVQHVPGVEHARNALDLRVVVERRKCRRVNVQAPYVRISDDRDTDPAIFAPLDRDLALHVGQRLDLRVLFGQLPLKPSQLGRSVRLLELCQRFLFHDSISRMESAVAFVPAHARRESRPICTT